MKALVVGGGGFVGPYLVRHLTKDLGYDVTVTKTEKETLTIDSAVVRNLDILDKDRISELLSEENQIIYSILQPSLRLLIHGRILH